MFDILVYLFENYVHADACPAADQLARKLSAVGFEEDEIHEALEWFSGLRQVSSQGPALHPGTTATRFYPEPELARIDVDCRGFLAFLENAGLVNAIAAMVTGSDYPFPSPSDLVTVASNLLFIGSILMIVRLRNPRLSLDPILDALVGGVAVALLQWSLFVMPYLSNEDLSARAKSGRRILLVDDEPAVCRTAAQLLRQLGHNVQALRSGERALTHLRTHHNGYDLLVLDVMMPHPTGVEVYRALREHGITLPTIFVSGYSELPLLEDLLDQAGVVFLQKPFRQSELADAMRRALEASARRGLDAPRA